MVTEFVTPVKPVKRAESWAVTLAIETKRIAKVRAGGSSARMEPGL